MGKPGNPHPTGGKPDKLIRDALMVALNREARDAEGRPTRKLALIAEKLVEKAISGDVPAIKEIADRVDGRPAQALQVSGAEGEPLGSGLAARIAAEAKALLTEYVPAKRET